MLWRNDRNLNVTHCNSCIEEINIKTTATFTFTIYNLGIYQTFLIQSDLQ